MNNTGARIIPCKVVHTLGPITVIRFLVPGGTFKTIDVLSNKVIDGKVEVFVQYEGPIYTLIRIKDCNRKDHLFFTSI